MQRVLIFLAIAFFTNSSFAADKKSQQPYVAVVGVGEAAIQPDQLKLVFSISERADTSDAVSKAVNAKAARILEATKASETTPKITTEGITITPRFEYDRDNRQQRLVGYLGRQSVTVLVDGIVAGADLYDQLTNKVLGIGSSIAYATSNETALIEKARALAFEDAKRRAKAYAKAVDQFLGPALIVEESGTDSQRLRFNLQDKLSKTYRQSEAAGGGLEEVVVTGSRLASDGASSGAILEPDAIRIAISIYAKFQLFK